MSSQALFYESSLERRFRAFHEENPHVYDLFKRFTFEALNAGHQYLSADMVAHRIRWETSVVTRDQASGFKINNNHVAYYARLFMRDFPRYKGFFRTRAVT